jgi:hypothetical protein
MRGGLEAVIPRCIPAGKRAGRGLEAFFASDDAKPSDRFAHDTSSPAEHLTRRNAGRHKPFEIDGERFCPVSSRVCSNRTAEVKFCQAMTPPPSATSD